MTVHLNAIEAFWISLNLLTAILTTVALVEARRDWAALKRFNGSTRGVVARANIRSEWIRLAIQVALLAVAVPAVFSARETPLTPGLLIFLTVPVLLLLNSLHARHVRGILSNRLEDDIRRERDASLARLEAKIDENTVISQGARDDARDAAELANSVNEKIATQGEALILQGEEAAADREVGKDTNETAHRIDERIP